MFGPELCSEGEEKRITLHVNLHVSPPRWQTCCVCRCRPTPMMVLLVVAFEGLHFNGYESHGGGVRACWRRRPGGRLGRRVHVQPRGDVRSYGLHGLGVHAGRLTQFGTDRIMTSFQEISVTTICQGSESSELIRFLQSISQPSQSQQCSLRQLRELVHQLALQHIQFS